MPSLNANGIEICYDTTGSASGEPLLLIMGLGGQMTAWEDEFCQGLAGRGHFVVRFDNRDVGLSTKLAAAGVPNLLEVMTRMVAGETIEAAYTLDDMADDAVGVLDALDLEAAHVVGASMGGMIAQALALRHPARLKTLVSIMSSTGNPELPRGRPEAMAVLMRERAVDREGSIAQAVAAQRVLSGTRFPFDEARMRERAGQAYDRSFYPEGVARQMAAVVASGSRRSALASVDIPTLVIHGDGDPLVPIEAGRDTAEAIPGAELLVIEGMGHSLPPELFSRLVTAIAEHTRKARARA